MKKILIASKNKGKIAEFEALLADLPFKVYSLLDFADIIDIEETGLTFEENALIKARFIAENFPGIVVADDSGIEVDVLNGRPGVFSARYSGVNATDESNTALLLEELKSYNNQSERTGRFRCVLAIIDEEKNEKIVDGVCEGFIGLVPVGSNGFGYDPLFKVDIDGLTLAQMSKQEKNAISHRAKAFNKMVSLLKSLS